MISPRSSISELSPVWGYPVITGVSGILCRYLSSIRLKRRVLEFEMFLISGGILLNRRGPLTAKLLYSLVCMAKPPFSLGNGTTHFLPERELKVVRIWLLTFTVFSSMIFQTQMMINRLNRRCIEYMFSSFNLS